MPAWSDKLPRIVRDLSGRTLRTRADVRAYMLELPEARQLRNAWQETVRLLLEEADAEALTTQLELALLLELQLDVR